jgi:hypothetical protein
MSTPRKSFALAASIVSLALVAAGCGGSGNGNPTTYAISGTVSGAVSSGVTVSLSGAATASTTTDSSGNYSFSGLADGSYAVTPSLAGYSFTPASLAVAVSGASVTGRNFTSAALPTHSVSGAVSGAVLSGVTITLGGAASRTTTTDASGNYVFTGLLDGAYTVAPSLTGYAFNPVSRQVTVSGASVTGMDFAASTSTGPTYAISGAVSGVVMAGVTVTLGGTAAGSASTDASGNYSFSGLANGAYTVTPSLSHYVFTPASRSVTVSGANVTGQNFTSSAAPTYTLSGAVTGPWVENVTVSLGGDASATTHTNSSGAYSFQGLYAGSYTVAPSLAGYTYTPSGPTVTITAADATQNFTASADVASYSVSGTVSYGGSKVGRVYIGVVSNNCGGCSPLAGTSISAPGPFTVRGLGSGDYMLVAWRDAIGYGARNATDPQGSSATVTIVSADATGVTIALADPAAPTPHTPTGLGVFPGNNGAVLFWDSVTDASNTEAVTAYKIYWGTDAAASNQPPITVPAMNDAVYIQGNVTNGTSYYYRISSLVEATESAASGVVGPVIIGAIAGGNTLSGSVTFPGAATGPMYVGAFDQNAGVMRATRIASPTSPQAFTVTGIPSGSNYFVFAILDQNNNGLIDAGDLSNTNGGGNQAIAITGATTQNVTLSGANADVRVATQHQIQEGVTGSDSYYIQSRVSGLVKLPVAVTLYSGLGAPVPVDVAKYFDFETFLGMNGRPNAGDTYGFKVWYSDGTSELKSGTISAVLDSFAQNLTVTPTPSSTVPTFSWSAPASPPTSYVYHLSLYGPSASWFYPQNNGMPSTQLTVQYNFDGNANPSSLVTGTTYYWSVVVQDQNDNQASILTAYTP